MMFKKTILLLVCILIPLQPGFAIDNNKIYIIPKVALILPKDSQIKSFWVVNPQECSVDNINFCIADVPIIGYLNKFIFYPTENAYLTVKSGYSGFICFSDATIIFYNKNTIGYLKVNSQNTVDAVIEPIANLPKANARLFASLNKTLYSLSFDNTTKTYNIYIFKKTKPYGFLHKYAQTDPIESVSGDGENIIICSKNKIYIVKDGKKLLYYTHPSQNFKQIIYSGYGVFYTTVNSVGFIQNNQGMEFVKAQNPKIFLKDNILYVMFPTNMGIIGLLNIDGLRKYNFPIRSLKWKE